MRPLTDREKRTIRFAGIGIAIYLGLFGGFQVWKFCEKKRSDYRQLTQEAQNLRQQVKLYQDRALVAKKLMEDFQLDPAKLRKGTVVSDASAAIQKAAKSGGLQLGPIRETPTRGAGKSLATMQLESSGQVPAVLTFLASLNRIGFPVVVDSVQFSADKNRPDQLKINLTLTILDFEPPKSEPAKTTARSGHRRSSAELYSAVSRICNPPTAGRPSTIRAENAMPNEIRRYSRLEICATKEAAHA